MGKITKYLNQLTVGNVFDNPEILETYSMDRSALKIKPKFVAFPESTADIQKLLKFFNQLSDKDIKVPIAVRGSGLSEGGGCLSNGIIISTEKLNRMLEIDQRERLVRVQSGIKLKELNTALSVSGLTIPIDGQDNRTIGGLISDCPTDDCAHKYGGIANYVERIEVILANGDCLQTERYKKYSLAKKAVEKTREGEIYRKIAKLLKDNDELIHELSQNQHDQAGYAGISKVQHRETVDLMPLFFGAQGTLGIISEVILRAVPIKKKPVRVAATFKDISSAIKYMDLLVEMRPRILNIYDLKIIMEAKESGKNLDGIIKRLEDGYVVFASFDERGNYYTKKIQALKDTMPRNAKFIFDTPENQLSLNEFENSLTNYLGYVKNGERVPILTNFYLPRYNIKNFLDDLKVLSEKTGLDLELYGSYANSIFNLRPKFNLEEEDFNKKAATFLKAGAYIIGRQGGNIAGGTPEGRLKAVVTNVEMLESKINLYEKIKKIFDPNDTLNPDVKLGVTPKFTLTHFRNVNHPKIML